MTELSDEATRAAVPFSYVMRFHVINCNLVEKSFWRNDLSVFHVALDDCCEFRVEVDCPRPRSSHVLPTQVLDERRVRFFIDASQQSDSHERIGADNPNRVPEAVVETFASVVCPLPQARLAPHVNQDPLDPESFLVRDEVPEAIFEFVLDTERTIESFMFEELRKILDDVSFGKKRQTQRP